MRKAIQLSIIPILSLALSMFSMAKANESTLRLNASEYKISLQPQLSIANQNLALLLWSIKNSPNKSYDEFQLLQDVEGSSSEFEFVYRFEDKVATPDKKIQVIVVKGRGEIRNGNFYVLNFILEELMAAVAAPSVDLFLPSGGVGIGTRPPLDLPEDWQDLLPPLNCKF